MVGVELPPGVEKSRLAATLRSYQVEIRSLSILVFVGEGFGTRRHHDINVVAVLSRSLRFHVL